MNLTLLQRHCSLTHIEVTSLLYRKTHHTAYSYRAFGKWSEHIYQLNFLHFDNISDKNFNLMSEDIFALFITNLMTNLFNIMALMAYYYSMV